VQLQAGLMTAQYERYRNHVMMSECGSTKNTAMEHVGPECIGWKRETD